MLLSTLIGRSAVFAMALLAGLALVAASGFSLPATGLLPGWIAFPSVSAPMASHTNTLMR